MWAVVTQSVLKMGMAHGNNIYSMPCERGTKSKKEKFISGPASSSFRAPCGRWIGSDPTLEAPLEEKNLPKNFWHPCNRGKNYPPVLCHATWHPNIPDNEKSVGNIISAPHGIYIVC